MEMQDVHAADCASRSRQDELSDSTAPSGDVYMLQAAPVCDPISNDGKHRQNEPARRAKDGETLTSGIRNAVLLATLSYLIDNVTDQATNPSTMLPASGEIVSRNHLLR
jgi:hypothetical protein